MRTRRSRLRRAGIALGAAGIGALVVFHVALFARRLEDLSILQPAIAAQWVGTAGLLVFLAHLRRRRVSLLEGRSALAFWLLVLLLHLVPGTPSALVDGEHADLLLAVPTTWLTAAVLVLATLALLVAERDAAPVRAVGRARRRRGPPRLEPGFARARFARPPPLAIG